MYLDLVSLVQPTIIFTRLCGVCPSALRDPHVPTSNKIYSLLACLFFISFNVLSIIDSAENYRESTRFLFIVFGVVVFNLECSLLLTPHLRKGDLIEFFATMETAQEYLHRLNIRQPPDPSKKSQICWVLFFLHSIFVTVIFNAFILTHWYVLAVNTTTILIISGVYAKLRVLFVIVSRKFDLLNWHLDDLNNRWPLFLPRPLDVTFSEFPSVSVWRSTHFVRYDRYVRDINPDKVMTFNRAHFYIHSAYRALNKVFSVDLLALTFYQGAYFVLGIYMALPGENSHIVQYYLMYMMLYHFASFCLLMTHTTKIRDKSQKTALLVHDLLDEERHSPAVQLELEKFSKSLLQRDMNFTAGGFFSFDLKLVSKMASFLVPITIFFVQRKRRAQ